MKDSVTSIQMRPDPTQLDSAFEEVERHAESQQWPDGLVFQIKLVLEELAMNVINYGNPGGTEPIEIALATEGDNVIVKIADFGQPFDPLRDAPTPDLSLSVEERPVGGLGLYLVKTMMDEIHYRWKDGRNLLTLIIRRA